MTTTQTNHESEVARALAAIKMEYEAAQRGLSGPAAVARHDRIVAQQQRIAERFQDLADIVGDKQQAMVLFASTLEYVEVGGSHAHQT